MEPGTREHADRLYLQGLRLVAQSTGCAEAAKLQLAAQLCRQAAAMYRTAGHHDEAGKVERSLAALYKKTYSRLAGRKDQLEARPVTSFRGWHTFLKVGCFGFGGPMGVFTLLEHELVGKQHVLTEKEFLEGAVLADVLPGPVTMDIVTYAGYKLRKWSGALISTSVFVAPSFLMMIVLAMLYDNLRVAPAANAAFTSLAAAIPALIISVAVRLSKRELKDYRELCIVICALGSSLVLKLDIVLVVGLAGLAGVFLYPADAEEGLMGS